MGEAKGYLCDGCGETRIVLDGRTALESVMSHGWFQIFGPRGWPTLYACSPACVGRAVENQLRHPLPQGARR